MKLAITSRAAALAVVAFPLVGVASDARADVITDWNVKTSELITESKLGTPPAIRVMAIVQTAAYAAVNSITGLDRAAPMPADAPAASIDAAVAAAHRATLTKLLPGQQAAIDAAYQAALGQIADSPAKASGIEVGERAAATVFALRAKDIVAVPDVYRPHTTAGTYVPTASPAALPWTQRAAWQMTSPAQFRVAPPSALASDIWARDYNEVKEVGAKSSAKRTAEQTDIARFWEYSLPAIYFGAVRSVADQSGRDVARNARLYAAAAQAMDDAMIGVFDAKYAYNFWRPTTAIRNGDIDGNDATARDPSWAPLIDAPMHPEYPSGHSTLAGAVGTVLKAEIGRGATPVLATTSPTAKGAARHWTSVDEFMREVADSRVYAGIHYRGSIEAGAAMGQQIGGLVADRMLPARSIPQFMECTARRRVSCRHASSSRLSEPLCDARGSSFARCRP